EEGGGEVGETGKPFQALQSRSSPLAEVLLGIALRSSVAPPPSCTSGRCAVTSILGCPPDPYYNSAGGLAQSVGSLTGGARWWPCRWRCLRAAAV
ncbi:MAG: hypothetical protein QME94_19295, partial [Anaerolineae bacterium]|nr:hypothetical protein [Anaerolineae bacterium]